MDTAEEKRIQIRSEEELLVRRKCFFELADLLEKHNFGFFLCFGVLLGAVREKNFIPWDWDIEYCVYTKDIFERKDELMKLLTDNGFEIIKLDLSFENFKIDLAKYSDPDISSYTVVGWYRDEDMWKRRTLRIPAKFLDTLETIEFLGRTFKCPSDPEAFLEFQYGKDWRTPKRTGDPDIYWTAKAHVLEGTPADKGGYLGYAVRKAKRVVKRALKHWGVL